MNHWRNLVVVSNRLPIIVQNVNDRLQLSPDGGGLVTALSPILKERGGCWVGSLGVQKDDALLKLAKDWSSSQGFSLEPVFLTSAEQTSYYDGFSNEIIWPLFHGLPSRCKFGCEYWHGYCKANEKFATAVQRVWNRQDFIWVHDFHLMLVGGALRARGWRGQLGYFHHIPFPPPDIFETLPWRMEVLHSLMQFNTIGFQTCRDQLNFLASLQNHLPAFRAANVGDRLMVWAGDRRATVGTYPISIDYDAFANEANAHDVSAAVHAIREQASGLQIILGIDRMDYTKGICERLMAFQTLLERHAELRGKVTLIQAVIPSREQIPEYSELKLRIEAFVSKINGEFSKPGWTPIQYFHRCLSRTELLALYRAADIAVVTPLKDGMNLVSKEFCATRTDNLGVLILSEFAGAAQELKCGALVVNPHHITRLASVLHFALLMDESEQTERMELMRSQIRKHDVFTWARSFLAEGDGLRHPRDHHIELGEQPSIPANLMESATT
jgi:alpha,alpha-trehalose-phosphate synthase [UDP-forming]